jgi:sulfur relay (sulfurtransferase) DsrF/TusC family protein
VPRYLSVVETPYRAVYEEGVDTALWFTHALKNAGAGVGVLLRGNAIYYGVKDQKPPALRFGGEEVSPLRIEQDIRDLMLNHITVYAVVDDAADRGIFKDDMILGLQHLPRGWLSKLYDSYERVLHW